MIHRHQKMGNIVVLGVLVASLSALGQTPKEKERQEKERAALLEEASKARDAEDHVRALSLAARAAQIRMTTSVREFIAEEEKAVGRLADAMNNAEICVREATENKALNEREKILSACKTLVADLQRSSARIIISMFNRAPPETQVTIGGNLVPESLYGLPYYAAPGTVRVEASAPGYFSFHRELAVGPGEEATVTVVLSRDTSAAEPVQPPRPAPAAAISAKSESPTIREVGPYVLMGTGAVSLGASAIFLISRNNAVNSLDTLCGKNNRFCPDTAKVGSLQNQASTNNLWANVTLVVGAAALVGGGVWWFLDRNRSTPPARASLQIIPTQGGAVVTVAGAL